MLNADKLKNEIANGIKQIVIPAIETIELAQLPPGKLSEDMAKNKAKMFDELVTNQLADVLANSIDYYIKNANITGTIITTGSPTTQVAKINPAPTPITGGKVPNTFGIN